MSFNDCGYRIFPQLFLPSEIERLRMAFDEICRTVRPDSPLWGMSCSLTALNEHRNPGVLPREIEQVPFIVGGLPALSPVFASFLLQEPLWAAAQECLGSKEIVYHFSNVTRKPARIGPNFSWHRDYGNAYLSPTDSGKFFRALIPFEPMDEENGCTMGLPGTHLVTDEVALAERPKKADDLQGHEGIIPFILQPGDLLAIHSKLVHGGKENRSSRERNLMVVQFGIKTEDYLFFNQELFTGLARREIESAVIGAGDGGRLV